MKRVVEYLMVPVWAYVGIVVLAFLFGRIHTFTQLAEGMIRLALLFVMLGVLGLVMWLGVQGFLILRYGRARPPKIGQSRDPKA